MVSLRRPHKKADEHTGTPGRAEDGEHQPVADPARDRFGGVNLGSACFGWLVAVGLSALLIGIVGAVAAAVGEQINVTSDDAEQAAGSIGLAAAIILGIVLAVGYYAGGYVAGRMSRFDGARQGLAVWVLGLVLSILAAVAGWLFGDAYDVLARVDLPSIPVAAENLTLGAVIAGLVILVVTALAAVAGGTVGRRYHSRVDAVRYG